MTDYLQDAADFVTALLTTACSAAVSAGELPPGAVLTGTVELTRESAQGDLTANHALKSARSLGLMPETLASLLVRHFPADARITAAEAAGPGFINLRLSDCWYETLLRGILAELREPAHRAEPLPDAEAVQLMCAAWPGQYGCFTPELVLREDNGNPLYFMRLTCRRLTEAEGSVQLTAAGELTFSAEERELARRLCGLSALCAPGTGTELLRGALQLAVQVYRLYPACRFGGTAEERLCAAALGAVYRYILSVTGSLR